MSTTVAAGAKLNLVKFLDALRIRIRTVSKSDGRAVVADVRKRVNWVHDRAIGAKVVRKRQWR